VHRLKPSMAEQPVPGSRLLQGRGRIVEVVASARWRRFPPLVAILRSCGEAPARIARERADSAFPPVRCMQCPRFVTSAPSRSPPSGVSSMRLKSSRVISTSRPGRATFSFIRRSDRSTRDKLGRAVSGHFADRACNVTGPRVRKTVHAALPLSACMALLDRRDNVRIRTTTAVLPLINSECRPPSSRGLR